MASALLLPLTGRKSGGIFDFSNFSDHKCQGRRLCTQEFDNSCSARKAEC